MPLAGTAGIGSAAGAGSAGGFLSAITGPQAILGSAAVSALGSMFGGKSGAPKSAYREAATQTMQAKIRTARQMGIHPLYALGAATPGPQQIMPGQSKWGSFAKEAAHALQQVPAVKAQAAQTDLLRAQADHVRAQTRELNSNPAPIGAPVTGAQTFPASGPYDPKKMQARPALVPVVQPNGEIDLIGNQEAGIENPEFLAAWYMFKNYMHQQSKKLGKWMGELLVPMYHQTKGFNKNEILDEMIRQLDRRHGAGVRD